MPVFMIIIYLIFGYTDSPQWRVVVDWYFVIEMQKVVVEAEYVSIWCYHGTKDQLFATVR